MNLINTRKSIVLATKGYNLLKKKRETLVMEFFKLLKDSKNDRDRLQQQLQMAYKTTVMASTFSGDFELEQASFYVDDSSGVSMGVKNIMGVKIPEIEQTGKSVKAAELFQTSTAVSDVSEAFSGVKDMLINTAKSEQSLRRLILEIDKTKRRVNAPRVHTPSQAQEGVGVHLVPAQRDGEGHILRAQAREEEAREGEGLRFLRLRSQGLR